MLNKKGIVSGLIVSAAVVTVCLYACVFSSSLVRPSSVHAQELKTTSFADTPTYSNITELTNASTAVFIGKVEGEAGTRNLARDPQDPTKEDPNVYVEAVDYNVKVSSFLKGDPQSNVLVTEEQQMRSSKNEPFVLAEHFIKLNPGETYVFFAQKSNISGRYFATGQPFFFSVKENVAQVNTTEQELLQQFKPTDLASFVKQVKEAK
jgi:hypothetical protein